MYEAATAAITASLVLCSDPARLAANEALTSAWIMAIFDEIAERTRAAVPSLSDTIKDIIENYPSR